MTVYIVEDNDPVREAVCSTIQDLGFDTVAYRDGESFLANTMPRASDFVLVDLSLPGIPGVAIINWLRWLRRRPHIVAMSGETQSWIARELKSVKGGSVRLVRKPLTEAAISNEFTRILERETA